MQTRLLTLALAIALGGLLFSAVSSHRRHSTGQRWVFDIEGFDPRDPLRGHYLQYQLKFDYGEGIEGIARRAVDTADSVIDDIAEVRQDDQGLEFRCLCLNRQPNSEVASVRNMSCDEASNQEVCEGMLNKQHLPDLQRFYIPEARAKDLERVLIDAAAKDDAQVALIVDRDGNAVVDTVLIDGLPILDQPPPPPKTAPPQR